MAEMSLIVGGDHAGFALKTTIISLLREKQYSVKDIGPWSDAPVDYPDFAHPLAEEVEKGEYRFGILICGSGNGVAMAANKHKGVRAALCWNSETARLARLHNNANILCIPARFVTSEEALAMVLIFLTTEFEGGRHERRVEKIPWASA